jgi:hypothetical protein
VGEENVNKIRRKDVFGGIFASTVSLPIFGWLGNPHDVIHSRTGKPAKISTFATHVHGRCRVGPFFVTVLLDFCEAVDDMMCKYMEIIYESVVWAKNMRRKDVFRGIFASTVSLSIFGWLGNPHDAIRSKTGKPHIHICNTRARYSSQCIVTLPGLCPAASGKTGIL